jgi:Fur family ferric uptake transcriptional regulator
MAGPHRAEAKKKFMEFLGQKHLRITSQRQAIIDTVFDTEEHFTAEQLLDWSQKKDKSVSRATVYRTLPLLTESGLVHEMDFGKDCKYYDPNYADHPNQTTLSARTAKKSSSLRAKKSRSWKMKSPTSSAFQFVPSACKLPGLAMS